jgi:hypothetical protein
LYFYDFTSGGVAMSINNGNIGIGTTTPSANLHISDTANTAAIFASTDDTTRIQISDNDTDGYINVAGSKMSIGQVNSINAGNLNIDASGSVGIGTTAPGRTLEVSAGTSNGVANFISTDAGSYISFEDDSTTGDTYTKIGAVGNELSLFTGAAEAMRIDENGNVGIGTDNPSQKLHVSGGHVQLDNNRELRWKDSGGIERTALYLTSGDDLNIGTSAGGNLIFRNGSTYIERMRITNSGFIGIGTTTPAKKFHLYSSDSANTVAKFESSDANAGILLSDPSGDVGIFNLGGDEIGFYSDDGATQTMKIDSSGNVGIGTGSPNKKLHIYDSGDPAIVLDTGGTDWHMAIDDNVGDLLVLGTGTTIGSNGKVGIQTDGDFGIGTTAPESKLHVFQSTDLGDTLGDSQLAQTLEMETGSNILERDLAL